jgi:asparagine synthase (glutamine-hydrolysing)
MCGIAGIFGYKRLPDRDVVLAMTERLRHRGPIEDGFLFDGPAALGMRRLSIIDIEGGHQPVFNETKTIAVIFNGEIYNYIELTKDLIERGHKFSTRSDTEAIVHLYEEMGIRCLTRLNGMFALAIWDQRTGELFVARDRLGVKPLYYADGPEYFAFASEIKALTACPFIDRSLDYDAFSEYLTLMYIRAPRTPFLSIRKLLPGHYLRVAVSDVSVHQWWDLNQHCDTQSISFEDASQRVLELLEDAVRIRLRSDVPVGAFLSGGIDSSGITGLAAKHLAQPLNTYSVGFNGLGFDELGYARTVADSFGTNHHETTVTASDAIEHLPLLVWHLDEPLADSAIVPTYLVSKFAVQNLRVMLSGLGGDELFGGYIRYFDGYPIEHLYRRLPAGIRSRILTPIAANMSPLVGSALRLNDMAPSRRYLGRISIFPASLTDTLVEYPSSVDIQDEFDRYSGEDSVNRLMFVDALTYLPDDVLHITDRMSMSVSLEVRTPFLDYRLVEFAASLPSSFKIGIPRREWKRCLKHAMRNMLPPQILDRPKHGFGAPVTEWMRNGLASTARGVMQNAFAAERGILRSRALETYLTNPSRGESSSARAQRLWTLLVLEVWTHVFLRGDGSAPNFTLSDLCNR